MYRICLAAMVLLVAVAPAQAVQVGWSVDIHQNQFNPCADDFHVWGVVESMPGPNGPVPPVLVSHDDVDPYLHGPVTGQTCQNNVFDQFSYQIGGTPNSNLPQPPGYVGPWPPSAPPFYYFEANWWSNTDCIEYCHWAHFGLKFDVNDANAGYWLQGRWTAEHGAQYAQANTPMLGFKVNDGSQGALRLQNANPTPIGVSAVQLAALPVGANFDINNLTNSFFDIHTEIAWAPVPGGALPQYMAPDSFFDVFLESVALPGGGGTFGDLQPGQLLLSRQQLTYSLPGGGTETFWQYEMHEVTSVPEPSTIVLVLVGIGSLLVAASRRTGKA